MEVWNSITQTTQIKLHENDSEWFYTAGMAALLSAGYAGDLTLNSAHADRYFSNPFCLRKTFQQSQFSLKSLYNGGNLSQYFVTFGTGTQYPSYFVWQVQDAANGPGYLMQLNGGGPLAACCKLVPLHSGGFLSIRRYACMLKDRVICWVGNLGIERRFPGYILDIGNNSSETVRISVPAVENGQGSMLFGSNVRAGQAAKVSANYGAQYDGRLTFSTQAAGPSDGDRMTERMRVENTGDYRP
jgi:hypothetical protein